MNSIRTVQCSHSSRPGLELSNLLCQFSERNHPTADRRDVIDVKAEVTNLLPQLRCERKFPGFPARTHPLRP